MGNQQECHFSEPFPTNDCSTSNSASLDKELFIWRSDPKYNIFLPRVFLKSSANNGPSMFLKNKPQMCAEQSIQFERYLCNFSQLKGSASFEGSVYILKSLLKGHQQIFSKMGFTIVSENCCFLTATGEVRAWINPNYFSNQPWSVANQKLRIKDPKTYEVEPDFPKFIEKDLYEKLQQFEKIRNLPEMLSRIFQLAETTIRQKDKGVGQQFYRFIQGHLQEHRMMRYSVEKLLQTIDRFTALCNIRQVQSLEKDIKEMLWLQKNQFEGSTRTVVQNSQIQNSWLQSPLDEQTVQTLNDRKRSLGQKSTAQQTTRHSLNDKCREESGYSFSGRIENSQITELPWDKTHKTRKISRSLYEPKVNEQSSCVEAVNLKGTTDDAQVWDYQKLTVRKKCNSMAQSHQYSMNLFSSVAVKKKSLKDFSNQSSKKSGKSVNKNHRKYIKNCLISEGIGTSEIINRLPVKVQGKQKRQATLLVEGSSKEYPKNSYDPSCNTLESSKVERRNKVRISDLEPDVLNEFETYMDNIQRDGINEVSDKNLEISQNERGDSSLSDGEKLRRCSETSLQRNIMLNSLSNKRKLKKSYFKLEKEEIEKSSNRISLPERSIATQQNGNQKALTIRTITKLISSEENNFQTSIGEFSEISSQLESDGVPYSGVLSKMGRNVTVQKLAGSGKENDSLTRVPSKMPDFSKRKSHISGNDSNYSVQF